MDAEYDSIDYMLDKTNNKDIELFNVGKQRCRPGHAYGPAVRPQYLIHYIYKGKGIFEVDNKIYHLGPKQAFIIFPEIITYYKADQQDPWEYAWFSFAGRLADEYITKSGFSFEYPIFTQKDESDTIIEAIEEIFLCPYNTVRSTAYAHLIFSLFMEKTNRHILENKMTSKQKYVDNIINYIMFNYWKDIRIQYLAQICSLDRSYLCRIFKEETGMSPQEYLIRYRFERAAQLLEKPELTIADCARSIGYSDQLAFSKMFKKVFGQSPKDFRKKQTETSPVMVTNPIQ